MKVISSEPVSLAKVKEILESRKKESELGHEQQATLEYCEKFVKFTDKKEKDLLEKVMEIKKIPLSTAIKIVDISPTLPDLVRNIVLMDKVELSDEEVNAIVKLFKK